MKAPSKREVERRWQSGEVVQMMRNLRPYSVQHAELVAAISVPLVWAIDTRTQRVPCPMLGV